MFTASPLTSGPKRCPPRRRPPPCGCPRASRSAPRGRARSRVERFESRRASRPRPHGPQRIVLMCERDAEDRHEGIGRHALDRAPVARGSRAWREASDRMGCRADSGSMGSPSSVDPLTSAISVVTIRARCSVAAAGLLRRCRGKINRRSWPHRDGSCGEFRIVIEHRALQGLQLGRRVRRRAHDRGRPGPRR